MKLKKFKLAAFVALAAMPQLAVAAPVEYRIPTTQEEFDAKWTVVPGAVDGTWEWVDDTTPYAQTKSVADGSIGAALIISEPISMKAGDTYYLQAQVSSDHYNNDVWFNIVYGTDKDNLVAMKDDTSTFKCWGKSGGGVQWSVKPSDSSALRELKITEDGEYYIGIRSKKGSPAEKGMLCVSSIYAEKSVNYPGAVTGGKASAIPEKLGASLTWTWPTKNRDGSAIEGELRANIYRYTSDNKNELYAASNLIGTVTGGKPGEAGSFDDDENSLIPITEPGKYYYYVAPFNEVGENSSCSPVITCKWVGEETQFQPILNSSYYPAKATMIDEQSVEISFTPRKDAVNGGWFDESKLCLKVTRQLGNDEPVVITDSAPMVSPFVDNTLSESGMYTYRLYVVYKGVDASSETKLDPTFAGGTLPLPFSEDFTETNSLDMFNVLSTNSSYKWSRAYSGGYLQYYGYSSGKSVLATAPVRLEAGKTYHVSCLTWVGSGEKTLSIVVGTKADIDVLESIKDVVVSGGSSDKQVAEAYYSPDESGIYYFGFYAEMSTAYLYLDDVSIEETVASPAAVSDLNVAPDAAGALKSAISFTIPSTTNAGQTLESLDAVRVMRYTDQDTVVVKEYVGEECIPATAVSFEDEVPEAGYYAYGVVAVLGEYMSEESSSEAAWVGYDTPKSVSSFTIRAEINTKGGADVRWSALSGSVLGKHGGYVDAENLKYRIYRLPHIYSEEAQLAGETAEVTFSDVALADADWDRYSYGIAVVNGPQEGETVFGNAISGGVIDPISYNPDLSNDDLVEAFEGRAFVADNGLMFKNRGETVGQEYMAYLPAFKINDATGLDFDIELMLSRDDADYEEVLEVLLCTIEADIPATQGAMRAEMDAVVIPGSEQRELVSTLPVRASVEAPAMETVALKVPATGTYRLALRCASENNKGLRVHALAMGKSVVSGVDEISNGADAISIDPATGCLMLPENAVQCNVYRVDGTLVAGGVEAAGVKLANGMYVVRVVTADGQVLTAKIAR